MFKLRPYQEEIVGNAVKRLRRLWLVYLAMEVRTWKTLTSLSIAKELWCKRVLFITKKLVIDNGNVVDDYNMMEGDFELVMSTNNYKTIWKQDKWRDMVIVDEAHTFGAFPKSSAGAKAVRQLSAKYMILMSGTPTPETYSQIYHQFWMCKKGPRTINKTFYHRAKEWYVNVTQRKINWYMVNDYSKANKDKIMQKIKKYMISFSQKDGWFKNKIVEKIHDVIPSWELKEILDQVKTKDVIPYDGDHILMDTAAGKLNKYRQLCGGTCILDTDESVFIDTFKAQYIKDKLLYDNDYIVPKRKKLLIFYYYRAERNLLLNVLGDAVTEDFDEFRNTDKSIIKQIRNGREGVSYKEADEIVFYAIDYSATSYWQARDRLTTMDRKETIVHWLFTYWGVERKVYKTVQGKKNFTYSHFIWSG